MHNAAVLMSEDLGTAPGIYVQYCVLQLGLRVQDAIYALAAALMMTLLLQAIVVDGSVFNMLPATTKKLGSRTLNVVSCISVVLLLCTHAG